jgi:hypothetical protein
LRHPDAPLFTDTQGTALTGNAVRKLTDRLQAATGIDDLCAHMLRTRGRELSALGIAFAFRSES